MRPGPRRVFEAPKQSKRVRELTKRMKVDSEFEKLVSDITAVAELHSAAAHTVRGAADVVVQRLRMRAYNRKLRGESKPK